MASRTPGYQLEESTMAGGAGRYNDILDAFTRHIADLGYDGVNFGLVASELGVSKGTIVHHFGTKDRILAALHENYMTKRLAELEYLISHLDSPAEQLAAALHAFMAYHVEDRAATVAFQREVVRLANEDSMAEGARLRQKYFGLIEGILQAGIAKGEFRQVNARVDALLFFGSAQWAWTWFRPDGDQPAEAVGQALVDLVLGGLLVNRKRLAGLADPQGRAARTVRDAIRIVASAQETSP